MWWSLAQWNEVLIEFNDISLIHSDNGAFKHVGRYGEKKREEEKKSRLIINLSLSQFAFVFWCVVCMLGISSLY